MSRFGWASCGLVLVGCGLSEDKFLERSTELSCEKTIECAGETTYSISLFEDVDDCIAFVTAFNALIPDACEYDAAMGKACLDELEKATCDDQDAPSCQKVYSGAGCDTTTSVGSDSGL